jgi:hypothetical protein
LPHELRSCDPTQKSDASFERFDVALHPRHLHDGFVVDGWIKPVERVRQGRALAASIAIAGASPTAGEVVQQ